MRIGLTPLGLYKKLGITSGGGSSAPAGSMLFGGNLGAPATDRGVYPYVNLARSMRPWEQDVGSGSFTQHCGEITASVGTDVFIAYISDDSVGLASGTYRILNPTGAEIQLGDFTNTSAWTTSTDFNFTLTSVGLPFYIKVKGSLLRHASLPFAILKPGTHTQFIAGNEWDADFLSFLNGLNLECLRFMDYGGTNRSLEVDWTDSTPTNAISFMNIVGGGIKPPYQVMCDLANRLNVPPWFNIPTRATTAYSTSMITAINGALNTSLKTGLRIAFANELWNYNNPFGDNTRWVEFYDHTRRTATVLSEVNNTFALTAHGIANGSSARVFRTKENALAQVTVAEHFENGSQVYIQSVDVNTIRCYTDAGLTSAVDVVAGQVNIIFILDPEASKTADLHAHYSERSLAHWTVIDAVIGAANYIHVLETQAANSGGTTSRLAVAGMTAATDEVSIAPYMLNVVWFHGGVDIATTTLTPKMWGNEALTVYAAVYTNGSTPTIADIIAGTGAGYINKQTFSVAAGGTTYTSGTAFTGLTNGVTYSVFMVVNDGTYKWKLSGTASPAVSTSTTYIADSYANMALRQRLVGIPTALGWVNDQIAVAGSIPVTCYEGGDHFSEYGVGGRNGESSVWQQAYLESSEHSSVMQYYFNMLACANISMYAHFVTDVMDDPSSWKIADSYTDTSDLRYTRVVAQNGWVADGTQLAVGNATGTDITADPASFPQTVHTFANGSLTYTIVAGNDANNFDVSSGTLRLIADNGINWASPNAQVVTLLASDGTTEDLMTVSFSLGAASWYASDALWAHNTVTDTNTTQANPDKGSAVGLAAGAGASQSGGLWNNGGTSVYEEVNAMTASADMTTNDFLYVNVGSIGTLGANALYGWRVGVVPFFYPRRAGSSDAVHHYHNGSTEHAYVVGPMDSTPRAYWTWFDKSANKIYYGYNQTLVNASGSSGDTPPEAFPSSLSRYMVCSENPANYGTSQVVNRANMTLSEVLAIVQQVQTVHGI